jgi:L-lactate dehydrogenase complex protein LldG
VDRTAFLERLPRAHPEMYPALLVPDLPKVDLLSHFAQRLASIDGVVHGPFPPVAAADLVTTIFREYKATRYLGWDDVGVVGMHERLTGAGFRRVEGHLPDRGSGRVRQLAGYQDLVVGLTGADAGLAESGSIVVRSGRGRPRMASLIPLVHVAVLSTHRLYRSLSHYVADHPAAIEGTSNLVIITGPSRTGDIEQQLNLGVHGPKHLHVILVE